MRSARATQLLMSVPTPPTGRRLQLTNQPQGERITVDPSFAGAHRCDNDEDDVKNVQNREEEETDQNQTEDAGHDIVDQHRDLEVQRFFAVLIDLGGIPTLDQPDNQRAANVP